MRDTFTLAINWLGPIEGGYSTDRNDPGNWTGGAIGAGEFKGTKYGISAKQYPEEDIPNLTRERAHELYRRDYWEQFNCHHMPPGVDLALFDACVQHGRGPRMFQEVLRAQGTYHGAIDQIIGPNTIKAAWDAPGEEIIRRMHTKRRRYYQHLIARDERLAHNIDGWLLRLEKLHAIAAERHWREELAAQPLDVPEFIRGAR
jgi:lysozyme family protein